MLALKKDPLKALQGLASKQTHSSVADMRNVGCLILGGGQGKRLYPLTEHRSKPAAPFGGGYRLIDVALSNALSANLPSISIITQFFSSSLHRHIMQCYPGHQSIQILTSEERPKGQTWFQGTADAVRQNIRYLSQNAPEYLLILSGDQLYHLDFSDMLQTAQSFDADLLIATLPVDAVSAGRLGLMQINDRRAITDFYEKPNDPEILERFVCPDPVLASLKLCSESPRYLGSMGIYLFKWNALLTLLEQDTREDFGKHLIPTQLKKGKTYAYLYDGYWEDIGTIESFYHANIALTRSEPPFNCYADKLQLPSRKFNLPPPKILQGRVTHSILCDGTIVEAEEVSNSILGYRTVVRRGCVVKESYLMGNDSYHDSNSMPLEIGQRCQIRRAILDTNVSLGNDVHLVNKQNLENYDGNGVYIRNGIIVVSSGTRLPDGFTL